MTGQYDILIIKDLSRFSRRNSRGLVELEDLRDSCLVELFGALVDLPGPQKQEEERLHPVVGADGVLRAGLSAHFPPPPAR